MHVSSDSGAEMIEVDPILFPLVLSNLMINAVEAVPKDQVAKVSCVSQRLNDTIIVEFTDEGPGISPEDFPNLFVPTFTTKPHGSGLGLPLCKLIVEAHGGDFTVGAPTPLGTCFFVTIPIPGIDG